MDHSRLSPLDCLSVDLSYDIMTMNLYLCLDSNEHKALTLKLNKIKTTTILSCKYRHACTRTSIYACTPYIHHAHESLTEEFKVQSKGVIVPKVSVSIVIVPKVSIPNFKCPLLQSNLVNIFDLLSIKQIIYMRYFYFQRGIITKMRSTRKTFPNREYSLPKKISTRYTFCTSKYSLYILLDLS